MSIRTLFLSWLFASAAAYAQSPSAQRHDGRILTTGSADSLYVEVYEGGGHMLADRVAVGRDGNFTVNVVGSQLYEVRVVTSHGERIMSDHVMFRPGNPVELRLPARLTAGPPPAGPISARRLAHKPAKPAMRAFKEADTFAEQGNMAASMERLRRATEADPKWFEAWNNLGSRRIAMGQYSEAVEAFRQALAIDGNAAIVYSNLGLAYLFLRQAVEAEAAANRSLQLEPGSSRAAYVLGLALLQQNKRTDEAVATLRQAGKELPRALLAVAEWNCRHNEFAACAVDLRAFLKTPQGPSHAKAEDWLKEANKHLKPR